MQHEILAACLGHTGDIIPGGRSGFTVRPGVHFLSVSEQQAINRIARLGGFFSFLERFASDGGAASFSHGIGDDGGSDKDRGLYLRALQYGVQSLLDEFASAVVALEREAMLDPTLPVSYINGALREYQLVLPAVAAVCQRAVRERLRGARILELLHTSCQSGMPAVRASVERLTKCCLQVWYNQSVAWLLHGILMDPYEEYFVQRNGPEPSLQRRRLVPD
ncbi:unnamed protein product, partial [Phaeothamnion confervicola]